MDRSAANDRTPPIIWLVIPCFNEEPLPAASGGAPGTLSLTAPLFLRKLIDLIERHAIDDRSRVCFVNDGSTDGTWHKIEALTEEDSHFVGISLSRNEGHQSALMCGLMTARHYCDAAISMDCDGQDDIDAVDAMIDSYRDGAEIVYGVRSDRSSDSRFKRLTAEAFYKLLSVLGAETVFNHADYRLMSRRALDYLSEFKEVNLYLRGIVPMLGLTCDTVAYERQPRASGKTHYPLRKMVNLAIDGVTSLSTKPIRLVAGLGFVFSLLGLVGIVWAIVSYALGAAVEGWASTLCIVSLIGGIQLLSIGVIGEYIGKIYLETKRRPRYLIAESVGTFDETTEGKRASKGGPEGRVAGRPGSRPGSRPRP